MGEVYTHNPDVRQQIADLDDVLPQEDLDRWVEVHNDLARREPRLNMPQRGRAGDLIRTEQAAINRHDQLELQAKKQLFDQAVAEGRLSPNAIQELHDMGSGYVKIVTFKGESFAGTRYQVRGWIESVTGDPGLFDRLVHGERIQRPPIDRNNPEAVAGRVQDLSREYDARRVIRENTLNIDLRDPNLVNNPDVPEGLRRDATTPEFRQLVRAKNERDLAAVLSRKNEQLRAFMKTPAYKQALGFLDLLRSGDTARMGAFMRRHHPGYAQLQQFEGEARRVTRQVEGRLQQFASNNENVRRWRDLQAHPERYAQEMVNNPNFLQDLIASLDADMKGLIGQLETESQTMLQRGEQVMQSLTDIYQIPAVAAAKELSDLLGTAIQQRVDSWGLFDDAPNSRRQGRTVIDGSTVNIDAPTSLPTNR